MNAFVRGIGSNSGARTNNGAATLATSGDSIVDLFFIIGASRNMSDESFQGMFEKAYLANPEVALRLSLYARDVRGGMGERKAFRRILLWLERKDIEALHRVLPRVAELGRFDDLLIFKTPYGKSIAYKEIAKALAERNGLCAKWLPRKGPIAVELRNYFGMSPKHYRKTLVTLSNTVETLMCAKEWDKINLEHVPSVATSRYRKAFARHIPQTVTTFVEKVKKGEATVKAGAVFPHDIIRSLEGNFGRPSQLVIDSAQIQWDALPDYIGEGSFLPVVDVSGSMTVALSGNVRAIDIAVGLGIYCAERNKSAFKDVIVTFSESPSIVTVPRTNLYEQMNNVFKLPWGMSTNLQSAFRGILAHAKNHDVPREDMPKTLLIISDMEFNACVRDLTNYQAMQEQFEMAGYTMPNVVFWNVNGREKNVPVEFNQYGTGLVSGFSPSIMKTVLSAKVLKPIDIVLEAVMQERYNLA